MAELVDAVREALRLEGIDVKEKTAKVPSFVSLIASVADRAIQASGRYNAQVHVLGELGQTIVADAMPGREVFGLASESDLVEGMRASLEWCARNGIDV